MRLRRGYFFRRGGGSTIALETVRRFFGEAEKYDPIVPHKYTSLALQVGAYIPSVKSVYVLRDSCFSTFNNLLTLPNAFFLETRDHDLSFKKIIKFKLLLVFSGKFTKVEDPSSNFD